MVTTNNMLNQQTRDEIGSEPDIQPVFKAKSETVVVEECAQTALSRSIDNSWIVGHPQNAIVGTTTAAGGGQLVVGPTDNTNEILRVISNKNIFTDRFNILSDIESGGFFTQYSYIDSSLTTADISTPGIINFTASEIATSKIIAKEGTTQILNAILTVTFTGSLLFEVSNDGGNNFNTIIPSTTLTMSEAIGATNSFPLTFPITLAGDATPELLWRATEDGASTATLSDLRIAYNQ